jgi:uncharacterized protein (TIGR03435 family)
LNGKYKIPAAPAPERFAVVSSPATAIDASTVLTGERWKAGDPLESSPRLCYSLLRLPIGWRIVHNIWLGGVMLRLSLSLALILTFSVSGFAQQFEVASIKPAPSLIEQGARVGHRGGPATEDPLRYSCFYCDIGDLVSLAYDVSEYRMSSSKRLPAGRFHVDAVVPAGATRDQFRLMLQSLLAERFGLKVHRETRDLQAFQLLTISGSVSLKPHAEGEPDGPMSEVKNPRPGVYYRIRGKTLSDFAKVLANQFRKPVVDATGLTGKYDFDLWWDPSEMDTAQSTPDTPTLLSALRSVGLRVKSQKEPAEVLVVDDVRKSPTED